MGWETIHLVNGEALSVSGTFQANLPRSDFIGRILVELENENGDTSNFTTAAERETIEASVEKIEVIGDGNKMLKSYSGEICRKFAAYRDGFIPPCSESNIGNAIQTALFPVNFGRFPGDELCILPAVLYKSLEIKTTYNFGTSSDTVGFNADQDQDFGNIYVEVLKADEIDPHTRKILVETKKQDHTTVASGDKSIELTTGENQWLRQLLIFCYEHAIEENVNVTEVQLQRNSGNIIGAWNWDSLQAINMSDAKMAIEQSYDSIYGDAAVFWSRLNNIKSVQFTDGDAISTSSGSAYSAELIAGGDITVGAWDLATPSAVSSGAAHNMKVSCGSLPNTVIIDLDKLKSLDRMLYLGGDTSKLEAILTQGAAGGAVQVVEQRVCDWW